MKWCCGCQKMRPLEEFHNSKRDGHSPRCKPCGIQYGKAWYRANLDKKRAYDAKRREEKRHLYRAASKRFRDRNPGLKNADTQARRARLRGANSTWANQFFIAEIYDLAAKRSRALGVRWVVDHVVPLRGHSVCGLHVESNLRVIPEAINLHKSNKHEGVR